MLTYSRSPSLHLSSDFRYSLSFIRSLRVLFALASVAQWFWPFILCELCWHQNAIYIFFFFFHSRTLYIDIYAIAICSWAGSVLSKEICVVVHLCLLLRSAPIFWPIFFRFLRSTQSNVVFVCFALSVLYVWSFHILFFVHFFRLCIFLSLDRSFFLNFA